MCQAEAHASSLIRFVNHHPQSDAVDCCSHGISLLVASFVFVKCLGADAGPSLVSMLRGSKSFELGKPASFAPPLVGEQTDLDWFDLV